MSGGPFRTQVPVHSPLSSHALLHGLSSLLGRGDPRPAFRAKLCEWYGADLALLTGSGTSALQLALRIAHDATGGAPVALPAYTCYDVATAAVGAGASLTLYDLDPRTLAPDRDDVRRCIAAGARVLVVSPLFGVPVPWNEIVELAGPERVIVIEDAAQGFGASWEGHPLGGLGAMSVLSFGRGKGWTAGGGGALLFRSATAWGALPEELGSPGFANELMGLGVAAGQSLLARPEAYALPRALPWLHLGETRYRAPGAVQPMRREAATLLLETRGVAESEGAFRRQSGRWYQRALPIRPGFQQVTPPHDGTPGWLRFPLLVPDMRRRLATDRATVRLGMTAGYPGGLGSLRAVKERLIEGDRLRHWPGADDLVRCLLTLPTHSLLTPGERAQVVRILER